jgi:hypothetical protein
MELKQCTRCKQDKELSEYHIYDRDKEGNNRYRNQCKDCINELKRQRRRKQRVDNDDSVSNTILLPTSNHLSNDEIESIKELLDHKQDILNLIKLQQERIKIAEIEDKTKVKILVSLEETIKHKLYTYSKENNYSYSDIISLAVKQYLKDKI